MASSPATDQPVPSAPVTPTEVIARLRTARERAMTAEVEVLLLAVEWAHGHPDLEAEPVLPPGPLDPEESALSRPGAVPEVAEWAGLPTLAWDAAAPFAAANHLTTTAGRCYLRDALVLRHRLPLLWDRTVAGEVPVWQARRIAQRTLGRPDDVLAHLDLAVEARAGQVGPIVLDRLVDRAMLELHPEQREADQLEALDHRHATLRAEGINHTGLVEMTICAEWPDLDDFDHALDQVAAALAGQADADPHESRDTRRARAVGVLADPAGALALLATDRAEPERPPGRRRRRTELVVHLTDLALLGLDPTACTQGPGGPRTRPTLDATVRAWCSSPDVHLTVRPVLDLGTPVEHDGYQPTATQRDLVVHRDRTCVYPWCERPARACDLDHIRPWEGGGPTHTDNLAALCRHHHRLKTHAGWRYERLGPCAYLWTDPHGQVLLRTRDGTRDLTPPVVVQRPDDPPAQDGAGPPEPEPGA